MILAEPNEITKENKTMFSWALTFFIIALVAAVLGFGGLAGAAAGIAKIIFFGAIILLVVSMLTGGFRGRA